jgi:hypothetical protein
MFRIPPLSHSVRQTIVQPHDDTAPTNGPFLFTPSTPSPSADQVSPATAPLHRARITFCVAAFGLGLVLVGSDKIATVSALFRVCHWPLPCVTSYRGSLGREQAVGRAGLHGGWLGGSTPPAVGDGKQHFLLHRSDTSVPPLLHPTLKA